MTFLEYYRRRAGLTQLELARKVHVGQPKISQLENGEMRVGEETLKRIAAELKFPYALNALTRVIEERYVQ